MAREMRFLDIPDGHPLPHDWLRLIDNKEFEKHIRIVELSGPMFAKLDVDCERIKAGVWRLRLLTGFGKAHFLIFIASRDGNLLALHGYTGSAGALDKEAMAIVDQRILSLM
jgi:hypothetical protein